MSDPKKVVLAYSGGLGTSVILRWLIERYRCEVIAFCADLGQGEELLPIREKALRTGAVGVHIVDLREEFVRDFIFPMLRANAVYEGSYLLGTSIARPLTARAPADVALQDGAARQDVPAHEFPRSGARRLARDADRLRGRQSGGRRRRGPPTGGAARAPQPSGGRARHRPRGSRREPLRGDEVARRLRDARR